MSNIIIHSDSEPSRSYTVSDAKRQKKGTEFTFLNTALTSVRYEGHEKRNDEQQQATHEQNVQNMGTGG